MATAQAFTSSAVTTLAAASAMTVAVGDLVYAVAYSESSTSNTHTFTDSLGNVWVQIANLADPGNARTFSHHYSYITVAGSTTLTVTLGSAQPVRFGAVSYSGLSGAPLDNEGDIFSSDPGTGTDAVAGTALTPSTQPAWVLGCAENGYGPTFTAGTGFASDLVPSSWTADGSTGMFESKRVTSTSPVSATWTLSGTGTGHMVALSVVFAEAVAVATGRAGRRYGRRPKRSRRAPNLAAGWFGLSVVADAASWFDPYLVTQKAGGSPVYSRQTDETVAFTDAQTALAVFNSSRAETVTFADSQSSQAVFEALRAETITFTDAQSAGLALSAQRDETVTFTDSQDAIIAYSGQVGETVTFTDSQSALLVLSASLAESVTFTDAQTVSVVWSVVRAETVTLTDAQSADLVTIGAVGETVTFTDSSTGTVVTAGTDTVEESVTFIDSQDSTGAFNVTVSESITFLDSQTGDVPGSQVGFPQGPLGFEDDSWKDKRKLRWQIREELERQFSDEPILEVASTPIPDLVPGIIRLYEALEVPQATGSTIAKIVAKVIAQRRADVARAEARKRDDDDFFFLLE